MKALLLGLNIGLAVFVVFQGIEFIRPDAPSFKYAMAKQKIRTQDSNPGKTAEVSSRHPEKKQMGSILQRNLFKAATNRSSINKAMEPVKSKPEKTKLRLILWGTAAGETTSDSWAVIEDQANHNQSLVKVGDRIQGAEIKKITRNQVVLNVRGKDQILEANTADAPPPAQGAVSTAAPPPDPPSEILAQGTQSNINELMGTMKARPYLKKGVPAGVLIYGIRPGSEIEALGIKNGDIIEGVNGRKIKTAHDLHSLNLDSESDIRISMFRRGRSHELVYSGQKE